jgi:hypothetical protein
MRNGEHGAEESVSGESVQFSLRSTFGHRSGAVTKGPFASEETSSHTIAGRNTQNLKKKKKNTSMV